MSSNPEHLRGAPERSLEAAGDAAAERSKELAKKLETAAEKAGEHSPDAAWERKEVESVFAKEAGGSEKRRGHIDGSASSPASVAPRVAGKKQREAAFKKTMKDVQAELPASSRAFSKVIHNKAVEAVSDKAANTVARPNIILAGGICAFLVTAIVYGIARSQGFRLSGFEGIAAFVGGWILGALFDYFRVMVTGRRT